MGIVGLGASTRGNCWFWAPTRGAVGSRLPPAELLVLGAHHDNDCMVMQDIHQASQRFPPGQLLWCWTPTRRTNEDAGHCWWPQVPTRETVQTQTSTRGTVNPKHPSGELLTSSSHQGNWWPQASTRGTVNPELPPGELLTPSSHQGNC